MAEKRKTPESPGPGKATTKKTVLKKASASPAKKAAAKKTAAAKPVRKPAAKKTSVRKPAARKTTVKKTPVKKTTIKKTAAKKPAVKKTAVKKTAKPARRKSPATELEKLAKRELAARVPAGEAPAYPSDAASVMQVEASKFEIEFREAAPRPAPTGPPPMARQLDQEYGETGLHLLVRDPDWVFAYWEIAPATREQMRIHDKRLVLRWYDVTDLAEFTGFNAHSAFEVTVHYPSCSWYQQMPEPNRCWCAELGVRDHTGYFTPICRSQTVRTPPKEMAPDTLPMEWIFVDPNNPRRIFRIPAGVSIRDLLAAQNISEEILREIRIPEGLSREEVKAYYEDLFGPNFSSWLMSLSSAGSVPPWEQRK